jgi:hypothetical protein
MRRSRIKQNDYMMIIDRKHTGCHGLSFRNVIYGGVVHTSLILVLLPFGKWAKLRKVPRLVAVETWSSYLSSNCRQTALSYLGLWHCHLEWLLIPLKLLSILILPLWWPESCTRSRRTIHRMISHRGSRLGRT